MDLITLAQKEAGANQELVDTIVKEILHYDIMDALYRSDVVKDIVFQGGTALRLCYGGNRYSEDLDFVLSKDGNFNPDMMEQFKKVFISTIQKKYGLEAQIKLPKEKTNDSTVTVDKWTAKILIPSRQRQQPKINIEIANVPSYDNSLKFIHNNYGSVNVTSALYVETLEEILADKVIAVAGREYFKARDFWDIKWLRDKGVALKENLIESKQKDYGIEAFEEKFRAKINLLNDPRIQQQFKNEMMRFLDIDSTKILDFPGGIDHIFDASRTLLPIISPGLDDIISEIENIKSYSSDSPIEKSVGETVDETNPNLHSN